MRIRWMAPALAALAGCYFTPNDATVEGDGEALAEGDGSRGPDAGYGEVGEGRGKLEEGPVTVYWQWYDTWDQGTCMKVTVRNGEDDLAWWELNLQLDQKLTLWTYDDGAFFWPEGDQIFVEPVSSGSLPARSTRDLYYCAEPLHEIQGVTVFAERSDGEVVEGGDGGDGGGGGDPDRATRGELFPRPFTLRWVQTGSWDGGNCLNVTLINGEQALDDWSLELRADQELNLTSEWGAWFEPGGDRMRVVPNGPGRLEPGQTLNFGYCSEPATAIEGATAQVEVRPDPEPAE